MTYYREFRNYTAPKRDEVGALLWDRYRLEESANFEGPWTTMEAGALSPAITDPKNPRTYDFETNEGTLDPAWLRVVWIDTDDQEQPTRALYTRKLPAWAPSVQDVADHILQRTMEPGNHYAGTFTPKTRPDAATVERFIWKAVQRVETKLGVNPPGNFFDEATDLAAIRAAMLIELSFYAEQIETERSPYRHLKELWDNSWAASEGGTTTGGDGGEVPTGTTTALFSGGEPPIPEQI